MEATTSDADARWVAGIAEFDAGNYFEAHEVWEALWIEAEGAERTLLQGLVQVAAGYAKLDVGEVNGARKLFERGLASLDRAGSAASSRSFAAGRGIDLAALRLAVEEGLRRLRALPFGVRVGLEAVPTPKL